MNQNKNENENNDENNIAEISANQADLIKSFAIFYLLLVGNYVAPRIFTCLETTYILSHPWLQMGMAFFLFYFLVTLVSDNLKTYPPIEKLFLSLFYFAGFLLVMRLDGRVTALVLGLIFILYFLELNKTFYRGKDSETGKDYWITLDALGIKACPVKYRHFTIINRVETVLYYVILGCLLVGFISYAGELREIQGNTSLSWGSILMDTNNCRVNNRKGFIHSFLRGLRIR